MKKITNTTIVKKAAALALTGVIALPLLAAGPAAQADPPKGAPAWGHQNNAAKPGKPDPGNGRDNHNPKGPANNNGRDQHGYDRNGFDHDGRDHDGRDHDGRDRDGRDRNGFDRNGFDRNGFNRGGFDRLGYDRNGYDHNGYNRNGRDRNGHDRNWRPAPAHNNNWGNNNGYGVNTAITGTVIDSLNMTNTLRIRADNGRIYTVPTTTAHYYRLNNRVRVSGRLNGSTIVNASISRL